MRNSLRRTMPAVVGAALLAMPAAAAQARLVIDAAPVKRTSLDVASLSGIPASLQGGHSFTLRGRVVNLTRAARLTVSVRSASGARHLRGTTLRKARSRAFALRVAVPGNLAAGRYTLRACVRSSRGGKSRCSSRTLRVTASALPERPAAPRPSTLGAPAATAVATVEVGGTVTATPTPIPEGAPLHSLRPPLTGENFYFVMADRFENGDTTNDTGGIAGDYHHSGFEPTKKGYYHGGDLKGLFSKLDYIQGLGTTAIWLTPSFKNRAVQGIGANESAGYHGYWVTDFTQIDPHFGNNQDLSDVITAAHARGMKVFFDIITNHTADVISYAEGTTAYVPKDAPPSTAVPRGGAYRTAAGNVFDDRDFAGGDAFPALDAASSFPYTPVLSDADKTVKKPDWLNDTTVYHNRGDTSFIGENSLYGDFSALDDLFTEQPRVVNGMIDIYNTWVRDMKIDGFRIDTMKHVNDEFWQKFSPTVLDYAKQQGKSEFFMFGEVADGTRPVTSHFTTRDNVQAILDFPFYEASREFASRSKPTTGLRDLFQNDDWYTDADSNAYQLPTFLGNHDNGHVGMFLRDDNNGADEDELLARDKLAHALMYFSRGNPVVYFGDEQGFTGAGNDQAARQDMFPSKDLEYDNLGDDAGKNDNIGSDKTPMDDNFDPTHPLYQEIKKLADLTKAEPALRNGAMQHRYSSDAAGIYAFSRWTRGVEREYVVALNNSEATKTAAIPTFMTSATFNRIYGSGSASLRSDADRKLTVTLPPLSTVVYKAAGTIPKSAEAPSVAVVAPAHNDGSSDRIEVRADVGGDSNYEVTFWAKVGDDPWEPIGTDDNAPYRVFHNVYDLAPGTGVQYQATVLDNAGHSSSSNVRSARVGKPVVAWDVPAEGAKVRGATTLRVIPDPELSHYSVTFQRRIGDGSWNAIGADSSSPVYSVTDTVPDLPTGTAVAYRAVLDYGGGTVTSAERNVVVAPPPVTQAIIHYKRTVVTSYPAWGLHLFGDGLAPGQATAEWPSPTPFESTLDGYGALRKIGISDDTKRVGFVVHGMPPNHDTKDPAGAPDRFFTPADCPEIWLKQDDLAVYCSPPSL